MKPSLRLPPFRQIFQNLRFPPGAFQRRVRLPRREVLLVAAAGALAAVITLIVLIASFNAQQGRALPSGARMEAVGASSSAENELSVDDFVLPSLRPADAAPEYSPFRQRLLRWSRENVEKFWVSPRQIATDAIGKINDRNMENMFEKVK